MTWRIRAFPMAEQAQTWIDELVAEGWLIQSVQLTADSGRIIVCLGMMAGPQETYTTQVHYTVDAPAMYRYDDIG
jgi:hypothetical protein